jgi:carboxymethylenebutenolidase
MLHASGTRLKGGTSLQHSISHGSYASNGGAVPATMVRSAAASGALPGVIVIHEGWGADDHIRDIAERLAAAGYLALVPDLYAHGGARPAELAPDRIAALKRFADTLPPGGLGNRQMRDEALVGLPETERTRVAESIEAMFAGIAAPERFVADLRGAVAHLRDHPDCNGQIGAIGFCLGGGLVGLLACEERGLRAGVIYYGTPPPAERVGGIAAPLLGVYGGEDGRITSAVPAFADAMAAAGKRFERHVYPGAPHAFFNDTRPAYRVAPARDAWARTLAFLAEQLG